MQSINNGLRNMTLLQSIDLPFDRHISIFRRKWFFNFYATNA